uniref:Uncharacterized protein n=1 Tax=Rhizophora mucronata TaxID=61149 RepID=A0A2P2PLS8_RHIMU
MYQHVLNFRSIQVFNLNYNFLSKLPQFIVFDMNFIICSLS